MSEQRLVFGDRVRHPRRPEWGVGSVVKVEELPVNGKPSQRVSVRFPAVGLKSLIAAHAELERVTDLAPSAAADEEEPNPLLAWDRIGKDDWLAPVAQRKIEEVMIRLSGAAGDPFKSIRQRLEFTIGLYRFDRSGRGLIDWARAQTGLDDPLSRFNRHELERYFDRWASVRDTHLARLLREASGEGVPVEELFAGAPPTALRAARRASVR